MDLVKDASLDVRNSAKALFDAADSWGVFSEEKGTKISEIISPGESTVIDLSMYSSLGTFNVRALIIGLVSRRLFEERMIARKNEEIEAIQHGTGSIVSGREVPIVWIFIIAILGFMSFTIFKKLLCFIT